MNDQKAMEIFRKAPVAQAVLKNALPAMAAMLMVLVYNLADTFFIGQTHDALQVAAVSLATPVFLIFMAIGTVFGVGGTSVISRALGEGNTDYAKKVCAFCMWSCVIIGIIITALFLLFMDPILTLIGASSDTWEPTKTYLTIVSCSGPFVLISNCYTNVIRAEGKSGIACMGQLLGNLLNVILDPIMILGFHWNIAGAAIATVIGNAAGAVFYIGYFLLGRSSLSIHVKDFTLKDKVCSSVLAIGIPAALGSLLMSVSQIIINSQIAEYGDMAVAGIGVAMKVTVITGMICMGLGQGIQPLLGYCVGGKIMETVQGCISVLRYLCFGSGHFSDHSLFRYHRADRQRLFDGFDSHRLRDSICPYFIVYKFSVRPVLRPCQQHTGYGRSHRFPHHQLKQTGHHLHSRSLCLKGGVRPDGTCVGATGG